MVTEPGEGKGGVCNSVKLWLAVVGPPSNINLEQGTR